MSAFIGVKGYTISSGFILKELCIFYPNAEYDHNLFKMPGWHLTDGDKRTIRYTTQMLNNLSYLGGKVQYEELVNIPQWGSRKGHDDI